jgi:hypothetical protein
MNLYANGFRCAIREDGNEFIIQFVQETPTYNEDNDIVGVENEVVSSIVMTAKSANSLAGAISECINSQIPAEPDE